ncbi:MAG: TROVE domain-containing protein [Mogibacterium sp.]|nr:TROVE domain-containing protein [Mogibacterium sp.]
MSRFHDAVRMIRKKEKTGEETNYMGGISYRINPLDTLRMVTASSIFGEPQYYRDGEFVQAKIKDHVFEAHPLFRPYLVIGDHFEGLKTSQVMEKVIDEALDYDFGATIRWADTLRHQYNMRLNPQVIMVRAAMHPGRVAYNEAHPGEFSEINARVMHRADEPGSQFAYYVYRNGSKHKIPSILKRNWAAKLESLNAYQVHKYKNTGLGIIDVVRVSHAHSVILDELMRTGTVAVAEEDLTWETMRSAGNSWETIYKAGVLGHMALLRNLRGIFTEIEDAKLCSQILDDLKKGVRKGRQFPFRYYTAREAVRADHAVHHKPQIMDALEECIDLACDNMPKLRGKTMCLSDNSGSAWGTCTSEYGSVRIAEIDNLSSVITARNSDEGYVGKFGDKLIIKPVTKRNGVLSQAEDVTRNGSNDVGGATENGIWIFFRDAIDNKEHWDNIFIYSDMQAGHGGLYGTAADCVVYTARGFMTRGRYIDVAKMIEEYRKKVNPKVNVFCVQTAGYTNVAVPEYGYRTNIMYGWTGKEAVFADEMIRFWDEKDGTPGQ